jgi:CheY-like chemotaxis protein
MPKWILVADDDDAVREVWTVMLTGAGYRVVPARTGREALDLARTVVPDLIMLDLRMPEMDGTAFLEVFERAPVLKRIPVLIVTGFPDDDVTHTAFGLNIVARLRKPVPQADLLGAVQAGLTSAPLVDRTSIGVSAVEVDVSQLETLPEKGVATPVLERGSL